MKEKGLYIALFKNSKLFMTENDSELEIPGNIINVDKDQYKQTMADYIHQKFNAGSDGKGFSGRTIEEILKDPTTRELETNLNGVDSIIYFNQLPGSFLVSTRDGSIFGESDVRYDKKGRPKLGPAASYVQSILKKEELPYNSLLKSKDLRE